MSCVDDFWNETKARTTYDPQSNHYLVLSELCLTTVESGGLIIKILFGWCYVCSCINGLDFRNICILILQHVQSELLSVSKFCQGHHKGDFSAFFTKKWLWWPNDGNSDLLKTKRVTKDGDESCSRRLQIDDHVTEVLDELVHRSGDCR